MEHVNDDMDELFQKAGELYPLKTSESDWDGMLGKLRDEISGETGIPYAVPVRNNSTKRRWLLLMLIPAFIFSLIYFTRPGVNDKNSQEARKIANPSGKSEKEAPAGTANSLNSGKSPKTNVSVTAGETSSDELAGKPSAQNIRSGRSLDEKTIASGEAGQESVLNQSASLQTKNLSDQESFHEPVQKSLFLSAYSLGEKPSVYGMPFPSSVQKDITLNPETAIAAKAQKVSSSKGIYAVLLGGPDWSTVKLQSTEQAGYSLGVLVGYRFNKRLSVETGLLWDKKNYYSDGQYFDKSKIKSIHPIEKLSSVDGYCNMFEIPLNVSYSFASTRNHGFFVTTGLSSYLMTKEYYNYEASGYGMTWPGNSTYLNSSKNLFSILQISGGYEYSIGKNTNIRIEPYVKIPLGGIGIGNMPISSMGLYFGISHLFH